MPSGIPSVVKFVLIELLGHVNFFDNFHCM